MTIDLDQLKYMILNCNYCHKRLYLGIQVLKSKPCIEYKTYDKWLKLDETGRLNVLFIAESPLPSQSFFYNVNEKNDLREKLLINALQFEDDFEGLFLFKHFGYFLTDAIKCRVRKKDGTIPHRIIKKCSPFLSQELSILKPRKIVVLGQTALKALYLASKQFREKLDKLRLRDIKLSYVRTHYSKIIETQTYKIFITSFPSEYFSRYRQNFWEKDLNELRQFVRYH